VSFCRHSGESLATADALCAELGPKRLCQSVEPAEVQVSCTPFVYEVGIGGPGRRVLWSGGASTSEAGRFHDYSVIRKLVID
jgi:hypothetical protein